jgi:hypothetical protein
MFFPSPSSCHRHSSHAAVVPCTPHRIAVTNVATNPLAPRCAVAIYASSPFLMRRAITVPACASLMHRHLGLADMSSALSECSGRGRCWVSWPRARVRAAAPATRGRSSCPLDRRAKEEDKENMLNPMLSKCWILFVVMLNVVLPNKLDGEEC